MSRQTQTSTQISQMPQSEASRLSASRSSARQKRYREGEHALRLSRRPSAPCRLKLRANKKASDEFTPPMALDPVPQEICLSFSSRLPEPGNHGDQSQGNSTGSATGCTMGEETRVEVCLASAHDNPTDNYTTELARGYRVAQLLAMQAAGLDIRTSPGHQPRNHVFLHPAVAPRRHGCNRQCMRELCGKVSLLGTTFQLQHLSVFSRTRPPRPKQITTCETFHISLGSRFVNRRKLAFSGLGAGARSRGRARCT